MQMENWVKSWLLNSYTRYFNYYKAATLFTNRQIRLQYLIEINNLKIKSGYYNQRK